MEVSLGMVDSLIYCYTIATAERISLDSVNNLSYRVLCPEVSHFCFLRKIFPNGLAHHSRYRAVSNLLRKLLLKVIKCQMSRSSIYIYEFIYGGIEKETEIALS